MAAERGAIIEDTLNMGLGSMYSLKATTESLVDLPTPGAVLVGQTEVVFIDRSDVPDDAGLADAVLGDTPRYALPTPTVADYEEAGLHPAAQLSRAMFAVEAHRGAQRRGEPSHAGGEILATFFRPAERREIPSVPGGTRDWLRDEVCKPALGVEWLPGRVLLRRAAGYDRLR